MKKIWINGTFDVLHHGHFKMLSYASSLGFLCVGIDTDFRVKMLKGEGRPYHNQDERKFNLSNVYGVQKVFLFNSEDELINIIKQYEPDIFVIGSDYKNKRIVGREYAKEIIYFDRLPYSTTEILNGTQTQSKSN